MKEELITKNHTELLEFKYTPVDIEVFLSDPYFMGMVTKDSWPKALDSVIEIVRGKYSEVVLTGATRCSKNTRANWIQAYNLYYLSCLKNPAEYCGLLNASKIVMMMMNRTAQSAKDVTFDKFKSLIHSIPYFKEEYPYRKDVVTKLVFPNLVEVGFTVASPKNEALGQDFIGGNMDEMNFMEVTDKSKKADGQIYDQAKDTYTTLSSRIAGTFNTKKYIPSTLCTVTSRASDSDFTAWRQAMIAKEKGEEVQHANGYSKNGVYFSDYSQWEIRPESDYSGKKFYFAVSDGKNPSEIIEDENNENEVKGRELIKVPDEYRKSFGDDPEKALADIAGRVSKATGRYFASYMKSVYDSISEFQKYNLEPVFADYDTAIDLWDLDHGFPPINKKYIPLNQYIPRFCHIDLAITGDNAGIAIGYSPHDVPIESFNNTYDTEVKPKITFESILGISPPKNGRINFEMIRKMLYYLKERIGIPIKYISLDGFESEDMMQIMEANLFDVEYISVSGKNSLSAYQSLRTAFGEKTIIMPNNNVLTNELRQLIYNGKVVDHPAVAEDGSAGHNDLADAACGVHKAIMKKYEEGTLYDFNSYEVLSLY
ncbi:hypothetical protein N9043_00190 [bacterium]|nr:hypothetical protein [bacterium]